MKQLLIIILLKVVLVSPYSVIAQKSMVFISLRVPVQLDFQKTDMSSYANGYNPNGASISKASVINWGADVLFEKRLRQNIGAYIGFGYFNNRFGLSRFYDHKLLNAGIDSIPLGTTVNSYTYRLLRIPLGITYEIYKAGKVKTSLALEDIPSFSFQQDYNGEKPFSGANMKLSNFEYFGNSLLIYVGFTKPFSESSSFQLSPYLRIFNTFRKDPVLYELKSTSRTLDSFGIAITYSFTPTKK